MYVRPSYTCVGERMVEGSAGSAGADDCQKVWGGCWQRESRQVRGRKSPAVRGEIFAARRRGGWVGRVWARRTVPAAPSIVPIQLKMLSPSGKAEMPASALVCRGKAKRGNEAWVNNSSGRVETHRGGLDADSGSDTRDPGPRARSGRTKVRLDTRREQGTHHQRHQLALQPAGRYGGNEGATS